MQLGIIVSYVLGPLVILKSKESKDASASDVCSPADVDYEVNWSYYLMAQALLAFVVLLVTVTGECNTLATAPKYYCTTVLVGGIP